MFTASGRLLTPDSDWWPVVFGRLRRVSQSNRFPGQENLGELLGKFDSFVQTLPDESRARAERIMLGDGEGEWE